MTHLEIAGIFDLASKMILANNIKDILYYERLTQEELAQKCGKTKAYISQITKSAVSPSLDSLDSLASVLNCEVRDLFTPDFFKNRNVLKHN